MDGMNVVGDLFGVGQDVPAPGRQERPGHEEGRRPPRPVHRGREASRARRGRPGAIVMATVKGDVHDIGKNIVGVVLRLQQLRGHRPRRDGARSAQILETAREMGRRPDRPVGADHAVARGDAPSSRREMERAGLRAAAADRRRDDVADAHRGQDRAALPRPGRPRDRRVARGRRRVGARRRERRDAFAAGIRDEYATVRRERGERAGARAPATRSPRRGANRLADRLDRPSRPPPRPTFLGVRTIDDHPLDDLVGRIDWTPFFATWELQRRLPRDPRRPDRGRRPRAIAPRRRASRCSSGSSTSGCLTANGVVGFWPANSVGDDIELYTSEARDDGRRRRSTRSASRWSSRRAGRTSPWPTSRRRASPASATTSAAFAVTAGHGVDELVARVRGRTTTTTRAILAKALADRLAEAFAERLHELVRRELWGYAPDEHADQRRPHRRALPGHPAGARLPGLPGPHREGHAVRAARGGGSGPGSGSPSRSRCGPARRSAATTSGTRRRTTSASGGSGRDQLADYAERKGVDVETMARWLAPNLADA